MKKILIFSLLMFMVKPVYAYQLQQSQIDRLNSGKQVKVYSQYGSLQGYVKPKSNGDIVTYDKYHQRNGKYKFTSSGKLQKYNRAGH